MKKKIVVYLTEKINKKINKYFHPEFRKKTAILPDKPIITFGIN